MGRLTKRTFSVSFLLGFLIALRIQSWLVKWPVFQMASLGLQEELVRRARATDVPHAQYVSLVPIDSRDQTAFFHDRFPLDANILARSVLEVLKLDPSVVVVDLDTEDSSFAGIGRRIADQYHGSAKIIWSRGVTEQEDGTLASRPILYDAASDSDLPSGQSSGLAAMRRSFDWSIRTYDVGWEVKGVGWRRSLPYASAFEFCGLKPNLCAKFDRTNPSAESAEAAAILLSRYYSFDTLPLTAVYDQASVPNPAHHFANRIVVLGLSQSSADMHRTLFGEKPGMWLVASAIEQSLNGSSHFEFAEWHHYVVDLMLALTVVFIHSLFRPVAALFATLGTSVAVYFLALFAVKSAGYDAAVFPFMICILLEQLAGSAEVAQELEGASEKLA